MHLIDNVTWNDVITAFLESAINHIRTTPSYSFESLCVEVDTIKILLNAISSVQSEQTKLLVNIDSHPKFL